MTARLPLVSAVVPVYNAEAVIVDCIESILAQTYPNLEVIVVDDGSTDGTGAAVGCIDDPRIRYTRQANRGRGAARNLALSMARGEYIAICDADDVSLPERFLLEVRFLEAHPDVAAVSGQVLHFSEGAPPHRTVEYPTDPSKIEARFARGVMGLSHAACMIRRDVFEHVGPYCEECLRAQDLELFLRITQTYPVRNLGDVVLHYRNDPASASWTFWRYLHYFHEYARYRAQRFAVHAEPLPFARWKRVSQRARLRVYSVHLLRFAKHTLLPRVIDSLARRCRDGQ